MTLEGAINFYEADNYQIYTMNSVSSGQYCVVIPKNVAGTIQMLVDLRRKKTLDEVSQAILTKDQFVQEIEREYTFLREKYANGMLVLPMFDEAMLNEVIHANDKQKLFDEVKKIGAITSEIYKKLTDSGVAKNTIDQKIIMVERVEEDKKFVAWLEEQMPTFVEGTFYEEVKNTESVVNPFMNTAPVSTGNIFDQASSTLNSNTNSTDASSLSFSPEPDPVNNTSTSQEKVDIFSTPMNIPSNTNVPSGNVENTVVENNSNVSSSINNSILSTVEPVQDTVAVEPKPVNQVDLEGTTTFSTVSENNVSEEKISSEKSNESKGFVNLAILAVILIAVTFVSIELGKYLYSVYGA